MTGDAHLSDCQRFVNIACRQRGARDLRNVLDVSEKPVAGLRREGDGW